MDGQISSGFVGSATLVAGATTHRVSHPNTGSGTPNGAFAEIMLQGGRGTQISARMDWTTLNPCGGVFYFSQAIPADGNIYKIVYLFV